MKKCLSTLLAVCMLLALVPVSAMAADLTISTLQELKDFAAAVNSGNTYEGMTVELTASITLDGAWTPIGTGSRSGSGYSGNAFKGTFNGNNNTISGLTNPTGLSDSAVFGLFGVVDGGTVKNLKLDNVNINSDSCKNVGAAIGLMVNGASAESITVSGSVTAVDGVGGVVGRMTIEGSITNCINNANVTGTASSAGAGGIVGKAYYTAAGKEMMISGCVNTASVTSGYAAGGIVGLSAANVQNCTNSGNIVAGDMGGGIIGEQVNYGTVSGNVNTASISAGTGVPTTYGGIIGWIRYQTSTSDYPRTETIVVSGNTNSGSINGAGSTLGSGGIVGGIYNQATVTGNTNTASIITGSGFAAGIVGNLQHANNNVVLDNAQISVQDNTSTTPASAITATCTHLFGYNNDPYGTRFVVQNNSSEIPAYPVTFSVTPADATITVYSGSSVVSPTASGSYELANGSYTYTITKNGYNTISDSFSVNGQAVAITKALSRIVYEMLEENGDVYENDHVFTASTTGDMVLKSSAPYNENAFAVLHMGSKEIPMVKGHDYLVTAGSIKVTLTNSFLKTLEPGVYTLSIYDAEDSFVDGTFVVTTPAVTPATAPKTGDDASLLLWTALLVLSVLGMGIIVRKRAA